MIRNQTHTRDIKLVQMGRSKGICLPDVILRKYGFLDSLLLEETDHGILLRKKEDTEEENQLSWEETYKEMAAQNEDWDDFDITLQDGLTGEGIDTEKI
jgi:antitoxin MazE